MRSCHATQVSDDASASVVYGLLQEAKDGMRSNSVTGVQDFFTHEVRFLPYFDRAPYTGNDASHKH